MSLFYSIHCQLTNIDSKEFIIHNNLYLAFKQSKSTFSNGSVKCLAKFQKLKLGPLKGFNNLLSNVCGNRGSIVAVVTGCSTGLACCSVLLCIAAWKERGKSKSCSFLYKRRNWLIVGCISLGGNLAAVRTTEGRWSYPRSECVF